MVGTITPKRRIAVNFNNLSEDMQDAIRKEYPTGFTEKMMRIEKADGTFFYAVVYETDDTSYLVKIDVTIDGQAEDDEDKNYSDDDNIDGADEIADTEEDEEE